MTFGGRVSTLALAASLLAAPAARAAIVFDAPTQYCLLNGGLSSCATFNISSIDANTILVNVTNDGGTGVYNLAGFWFFYREALDGNDNAGVALTLDNLISVPDDWTNGPGIGVEGILAGETIVGGAFTPGSGLTPGSSGSFYFNITGTPDWEDLHLAIRGQGYLGEGSFLCDSSGGGDTEPQGALCEPPTVVPEPATMALLATGLVGMGGATLLRRRRQK